MRAHSYKAKCAQPTTKHSDILKSKIVRSDKTTEAPLLSAVHWRITWSKVSAEHCQPLHLTAPQHRKRARKTDIKSRSSSAGFARVPVEISLNKLLNKHWHFHALATAAQVRPTLLWATHVHCRLS